MNEFEESLAFVLEHECVYKKGHWGDMDYVASENEENDPGGLTKYGIDQRSHPDVDVENLTLEQAAKIYRVEYWDKYHCGELPWPLSLVHFDGCVNMGPAQQVKNLQRVVGVAVDGKWGPKTKAAAIVACEQRAPEVVALQVCEQKRQFYKDLAKEKPKFACFLDGWLNRVNDMSNVLTA